MGSLFARRGTNFNKLSLHNVDMDATTEYSKFK